jgi:Tetracyclin repressor-like, C-terminal domain
MAALAAHGFDILGRGVARVPITSAPERDLVEAGLVFRRFAVDHPSLFRIVFQAEPSPLRTTQSVRAAAKAALDVLTVRIARLDAGKALTGDRLEEAALQFHAVCEGLAGLELRGTFPPEAGERLWRDGVGAVVRGLASAV